MSGWENFFVAEVGASAALAGLLFVSVSVNLTRILAIGGLPERAMMTLIVLGQMLLISTCLLVPTQSLRVAGLEVLVIGAFTWATIVGIEVTAAHPPYPGYRWVLIVRILLGQAATLSFVIAGILMLVSDARGLDWTVPAVLFSFVYVFFHAWILLVEINR